MEPDLKDEVKSALALLDDLSAKSSDSGLSEDTCWELFGGPCPEALRHKIKPSEKDDFVEEEKEVFYSAQELPTVRDKDEPTTLEKKPSSVTESTKPTTEEEEPIKTQSVEKGSAATLLSEEEAAKEPSEKEPDILETQGSEAELTDKPLETAEKPGEDIEDAEPKIPPEEETVPAEEVKSTESVKSPKDKDDSLRPSKTSDDIKRKEEASEPSKEIVSAEKDDELKKATPTDSKALEETRPSKDDIKTKEEVSRPSKEVVSAEKDDELKKLTPTGSKSPEETRPSKDDIKTKEEVSKPSKEVVSAEKGDELKKLTPTGSKSLEETRPSKDDIKTKEEVSKPSKEVVSAEKDDELKKLTPTGSKLSEKTTVSTRHHRKSKKDMDKTTEETVMRVEDYDSYEDGKMFSTIGLQKNEEFKSELISVEQMTEAPRVQQTERHRRSADKYQQTPPVLRISSSTSTMLASKSSSQSTSYPTSKDAIKTSSTLVEPRRPPRKFTKKPCDCQCCIKRKIQESSYYRCKKNFKVSIYDEEALDDEDDCCNQSIKVKTFSKADCCMELSHKRLQTSMTTINGDGMPPNGYHSQYLPATVNPLYVNPMYAHRGYSTPRTNPALEANYKTITPTKYNIKPSGDHRNHQESSDDCECRLQEKIIPNLANSLKNAFRKRTNVQKAIDQFEKRYNCCQKPCGQKARCKERSPVRRRGGDPCGCCNKTKQDARCAQHLMQKFRCCSWQQ